MEIKISYLSFSGRTEETEKEFKTRMDRTYTSGGNWNAKKAFQMGMIYEGHHREWRKAHLISLIRQSVGCDFFIETGTFMGDTLMAVSPGFKQNWSVEAQNNFFETTSFRFSRLPFENVEILEGESPDVLPVIFSKLDQRPEKNKKSIIFLDAHFSGVIEGQGPGPKHKTHNSEKYGKCPLLQELDAISKHNIRDHIILIDDMRNLNLEDDIESDLDWPTSTEIFISLKEINPDYQFIYVIELDILIATTEQMNFNKDGNKQ